MNGKIFVMTTGLFFGIVSANATSVYIPDGSFEGFSSTLSAPNSLGVTLVGTNDGTIGAWATSAGCLVGLLSPCSLACGQDLNGTTPSAGSYDVRLSLAAGLGNSISLSQTLTNTFLPNSTYTLSLSLDQGTTVGLLSSGDIELRAGSTTVDSLSGNNLLSLMDTNNGFQTISLTYQTGNTVPTNDIGIYFGDNSTATIGGNIFLDNVQLDVTATPEPKIESMAALGALLMVWLGRRSKNTRF